MNKWILNRTVIKGIIIEKIKMQFILPVPITGIYYILIVIMFFLIITIIILFCISNKYNFNLLTV